MAFFGSKKEQEVAKKEVKSNSNPTRSAESSLDVIKTPTTNVSTIKDSFKVKATMEGSGSLIIGGMFEGDVTIDDTLFLEKGAKFSGTVHAKNVKISGDFSGVIYSTAIEITESGTYNGNIKTNKAFLGGNVSGIINSIDSIVINQTGVIDTKECKSKQIKVEGKVEGRVVASELLEVTNSGSINGEIITKGIRTEQGGSIIGNIQTYDENNYNTESNKQFDTEATNSSEEIDPEIAKLIKINPNDMQKYAKKEDKSIKRIPSEKKE